MFPTGFTRGMNPVNLFRRFGGTLRANRLFLLTGLRTGPEVSVDEIGRALESLCCCKDLRDSLLPVGEPTIRSFSSSSFSSTLRPSSSSITFLRASRAPGLSRPCFSNWARNPENCPPARLPSLLLGSSLADDGLTTWNEKSRLGETKAQQVVHLGHRRWSRWSPRLWLVVVSLAADHVGGLVARRGGRVEDSAHRAALGQRLDPVQAGVELSTVGWMWESNVHLRVNVNG